MNPVRCPVARFWPAPVTFDFGGSSQAPSSSSTAPVVREATTLRNTPWPLLVADALVMIGL